MCTKSSRETDGFSIAAGYIATDTIRTYRIHSRSKNENRICEMSECSRSNHTQSLERISYMNIVSFKWGEDGMVGNFIKLFEIYPIPIYPGPRVLPIMFTLIKY